MNIRKQIYKQKHTMIFVYNLQNNKKYTKTIDKTKKRDNI